MNDDHGIFLVNDSQTPSLQKRQFGIFSVSYSTPSKTSRKFFCDGKNVFSFKVIGIGLKVFTVGSLSTSPFV